MAYLTYNARNQITIVEAGGLQCSVSLVAQVQDDLLNQMHLRALVNICLFFKR
jgi:hypothetical protein